MGTFSGSIPKPVTSPWSRGLDHWFKNITASYAFVLEALRFKRAYRIKFLLAHLRSYRQTKKHYLHKLAWWIRFITKCLDIVAAGELYNFIGQVLKPTTRKLTTTEYAEARRVFRESLPYEQVRIDEYSLLAWLGAIFRLFQKGKLKPLGVTIAYTANFTHPIKTTPGSEDMAWLIHELVHVAQMQHVGLQYYPEAIYAQFTKGYAYGRPIALQGRRFSDFNREQQGEIVRDFYRQLYCEDGTTELFLPLIDDLCEGIL